MRFSLILVALSTMSMGFAQDDGAYQIGFASNLNIGDSTVILSNDGENFPNRAPDPRMNLCVNAYVFDPQEEEIGCCACLVTPDGLNSLSAKADLISNNLTPAVPTSITINLVSSMPGVDPAGNLTLCNPATVGSTFNLVTTTGLLAWGTTLAPSSSPGTYNSVSVRYLQGSLSFDSLFIPPDPGSQLGALTSLCNFIQANGSGFGICKSCRLGSLGGAKK